MKKKKSLLDKKHPNGIEEGYKVEGFILTKPRIGIRLIVLAYKMTDSLITSEITEIIDNNTFKTLNSIYSITYLNN